MHGNDDDGGCDVDHDGDGHDNCDYDDNSMATVISSARIVMIIMKVFDWDDYDD